MKFQIIVTPSMIWKNLSDPPYGALSIASALRGEGYDVRIESGDVERIDYEELKWRIRQYSPDVIGISSVLSTAYKYVKETTLALKRDFPGLPIIVGGGLGAAAELVLEHTGTDIVVIGEGDITIKELAKTIEKGESFGNVAGIAYKEGGVVLKTEPRRPIIDLGTLKYPAFDLIDMTKYFMDIKEMFLSFRHYKKQDERLFAPHRSRHMLRIMISRGCIGRCAFCYRPVPGQRHFSFDYIFDYLEYLMRTFNINAFSFGDECFAPTLEWNRRFVQELNKRKIDIVFQVLGMRVDTVDQEVLRAFKKAGCFMIGYGFESGSQKMLDIMEKRTTVEQNIRVALWTKEAGIYASPNFMFGMPGETTETIMESIDFLKKLDYGAYRYQYVYPLAVPGTPLYEYAKLIGIIKDEDEYLEKTSWSNAHDMNMGAFINFTSEPVDTLKRWPCLVEDELMRYYSPGKTIYFINKYLRPEAVWYSLKKFGLKKTLEEIMIRLAGHKDGSSVGIPESYREFSAERDEYAGLVQRYFNNTGNERSSLRQIIEKIKADGVSEAQPRV